MKRGKNIKPVKQEAANKSKILTVQEGTKRSVSLRLKLALILGVISFAVYANTLKNDFALDDYFFIKGNTYVTKGITAVPALFSTPHMKGSSNYSNDTYRPLSLVVFAVVYQFFGANPVAYHFLNILLFAGCVIILFLFLDNFFERKKTVVAFIASLLFALHPIHTEVAANCKSLDELLCFFFAFFSFIVFIKYAESGKMTLLISGSVLFLLSFLAKETVVTYTALIPLVLFLHRNRNKKRNTWITVAILLVTSICIIVRYSVLNFYHANYSAIAFIDNPLCNEGLSFESRIATTVLILGYYIKLLFIPYPLMCDYTCNSIPYVHFSDPWVLVSLAAYIFLIFFGIKRLLANRKDLFGFCILLYLIPISLFSNLLFFIGSNMAERFLFFPSVGFCLFAAVLIEKWYGSAAATSPVIRKSPKVLGIMIPVMLAYAVITINRNGEWMDNYTLYKADIEKSPDNCRLNFFLGYETLKKIHSDPNDPYQKQILTEAIAYLERALEIYPDYENAHTELGRAYYIGGNYDLAEMHEKKALLLNPQNTDIKVKLAGVYQIKKQYAKSIEIYKEVLAADPDNLLANFSIAVCYANLQNYGPAIVGLKKAIELNPSFNGYTSFYYLSKIYKNMGMMDSAKIYEDMVQKIKHGNQ